MANTSIQIKKSGVTGNTPSGLNYGELAINYADKKLYFKNGGGTLSFINNQDTFATVNANSSLILASGTTDTLTFVPGNNISISANTSTKTITINSTSGAGGISFTSSATAPVSPKTGDQWYFITNDVLYEYVTDGTTSFWLDVTGPTVTSNPVAATETLSPFLLMGA